MIEHLDPRIEIDDFVEPGTDDDVRETCARFDFAPDDELLEFVRDLGGRGFGYNELPGVVGESLNYVYSFKPEEEMEHSVLHALTVHDEPGVLPGYMPIAECNGNELWLRIADRHVMIWEHESWKSEQELQEAAPTLTELVSGLRPLES
jgi:hypothetical protein